MKYPENIREEELKNLVAKEFFWRYNCDKILGNIDFCVAYYHSNEEEIESLYWAEVKKGKSDIYQSIVQLIFTIGKARTFDKYIPPSYIGAFDNEKIAFISFSDIYEVFYLNDFNWNVAPSNHQSKEFQLLFQKVQNILQSQSLIFDFEKDKREIWEFIQNNFQLGKFEISKIKVNKNNFLFIYLKWLQAVKPTIAVNWDIAKKSGIIDADFYLADLLSLDNHTLKDKLYVLLKQDHYELDRKFDDMGMFVTRRTEFLDKQKAHQQFWNKYERPPKEIYWDYIIERRDLLVPQDIRERKGSFFTPQIWVELSQEYFAKVFGENWQEEYFIWDCAAGTGNLLNGLIHKYKIYASTIDQQDVDVIHDRIDNGANLVPEHVFQFDFLNDEFLPKSKGGKLPDSLYNVIINENKRKKLLIFINPPYAEAGDSKQRAGTGKNKDKVAIENKVYSKYKNEIKKSANELFAHFLIRIYKEIPGCWIGHFSTLKLLQAPNFKDFRKVFLAKLEKLFLIPSFSFDNVKGKFPIGFHIWNTQIPQKFQFIQADVFLNSKTKIGEKKVYSYDHKKLIGEWLAEQQDKINPSIGMLNSGRNDFQNQNIVHIKMETSDKGHSINITPENLLKACIFFAVRHCIKASWLNDRDQFLYPNNKWKKDKIFQNDCLIFTIFHSQNKISCKEGVNHWIPFSEAEVNAKEAFESNFMYNFIQGKHKPNGGFNIFSFLVMEEEAIYHQKPLEFSKEAKEVLEAGKELWKYYHSKPHINVNAHLYDIKEYFQGRNAKGNLNANSSDETYNSLIENLKTQLNALAFNIEPKVYEYEFLML